MSYIGNQPTSVAFLTDSFSGTGSQTAFTMSVAPANPAAALVSVSGVVQDPSTYAVSATTLTFSAAPPAGTGNISVRYLGVPASNIATTAFRTQTEFTATAGQTTFTPASYNVGFIDVYRNGVLLGSADFTATNGTTVVLATACVAGEFIETVSFFVSSVLNAIPATPGAVTSTYIGTGQVGQTALANGVVGNGPAFSAFQSSSQTLVTSTWTKVNFQTEEFDTNANFDTTNMRFLPTIAGYYQINVGITFSTASSVGGSNAVRIYKNGSSFKSVSSITLNSGALFGGDLSTLASSVLMYFNGSSDYVEVYANSSAAPALTASSVGTYFQGFMARSA